MSRLAKAKSSSKKKHLRRRAGIRAQNRVLETLERRDLLAVDVAYSSPTIAFSIYDPNTGLGGNEFVELLGSFDGATNKTHDIIDFDAAVGEFAPEIHGNDIPSVLDASGNVLYPIDSTYGFLVQDFVGATEKELDGIYREGWIGNQYEAGEVVGLAVSDVETDTLKSTLPLGTWAAGLGGNSVKASTEHYVVMAQLLGLDGDPRDDAYRRVIDGAIDDTIHTYAEVNQLFVDGLLLPNESTVLNDIFVAYQVDTDTSVVSDTPSYSITFKDDGKLLYRWGTMIKRPNDIRLGVHVPLPEAWTDGSAGPDGFVVKQAELQIRHTITNNPNDQLRPEDLENELATGRKPSYRVTVDNLATWGGDFTWVSDVNDYAGDGTYLPSYFWPDSSGEPLWIDASNLIAPAGYLGYSTGDALDPADIVYVVQADNDGNPVLDGTGNPMLLTMPDGSGGQMEVVGLRNKEVILVDDGTGVEVPEIVQIGTMFRDTAIADSTAFSSDIVGGYTWQWFTSMDRDPFEYYYGRDGEQISGPRWRLKSNKFGQDIPGMEIPLIPGSEPPFQSDNIKYEVGAETITTIDLLDGAGFLDIGIDLTNSNHWVLPVLNGEGIDERDPNADGVSVNGLALTDGFDFSIYIKGDRKPAVLYDLQLNLTYEAPDGTSSVVAIPVAAESEESADPDIFIGPVQPTADPIPGESLQRLTPDVGDFDGDGATDFISPLHIFSMDDIVGDFAGNTFATDPSIVDLAGVGEVPSFVSKDGVTMYPIDSEFGFETLDFVGAEPKVLDGYYGEGFVGDIDIPTGEQVGIAISDAETGEFKSGLPLGTWLTGLGGVTVKASTEHYVTMANILGFDASPSDDMFSRIDLIYDELTETFTPGPNHLETFTATELWAAWINGQIEPNESSVIQDIFLATDPDDGVPIYSVTFKDDGKLLYRWGTAVKRPNDVRLNASLAIPDAWTQSGLPYLVTSANLRVNHGITNNPNDQIRPEDLENELAKGRTPSYVVIANPADPEGFLWVPQVNDYAGDGSYLPSYFLLDESGHVVLPDASTPPEDIIHDLDGNEIGVKNYVDVVLPDGTNIVVEGTIFRDSLLREPNALSSDLTQGFTNAWYTTMDRDPFEPNAQYTPEQFDVVNSPNDEFLVLNADGPRWRLQAGKFGQDIPGVDIPLIPHSRPPFTKENIKYEVGEETTTIINLLDGAGSLDNGVDLRQSKYWVGVVRDEAGNIIDERLATDALGDFISRVEPNGSTSYLSVNGVWLSDNFDFSIYIKGDQKPASLFDAQLVVEYEVAVAIEVLGDGILGADIRDIGGVTYEWFVDGELAGTDSTLDLLAYLASASLPQADYLIELEVQDSEGTVGHASIIYGADTTAPEVTSVIVDDGTAQRSVVRSLTVNFDSVVTADPGAFVLEDAIGGVIDVSASLSTVDDKTQALLTFSGTGVDAYDSLVDGTYTLRVLDTHIQDAAGNPLIAEHTDSLFRLYGDIDGSGEVDFLDFFFFRGAYGTSSGDAGFLAGFDFDDDGAIGILDWFVFRLNYGKTV